jgi:hypothetical protein
VHGAALPRAGQDASDRVLEALVVVADGELDAVQAAGAQPAQKLGPERLGLDLAEVDADDLAPTALVDRVGDHQRLGDHAAVIAHLELLGVEPQVRVGALKRPGAERLDLLVQRPAQGRHAVLGHALDAQLLDEPVDLARRDAVDVGLHHDRDDRLLGTPARLQERREVRRARTRPGNQQLDLADPRLPRPRAVAVAMRRARLADLAVRGPDLIGDFRVHQLAHDQRDRVAHEVAVLARHHLGDQLGRSHPLALGHRGVSFTSTARTADELDAAVAEPLYDYRVPVTPLLPT